MANELAIVKYQYGRLCLLVAGITVAADENGPKSPPRWNPSLLGIAARQINEATEPRRPPQEVTLLLRARLYEHAKVCQDCYCLHDVLITPCSSRVDLERSLAAAVEKEQT
jgi:hypothetical protein